MQSLTLMLLTQHIYIKKPTFKCITLRTADTIIYYTCHYTYFYILSTVVGQVSALCCGSAPSLKWPEAATRGRCRLFVLLPTLLPRGLVGQKAGERLCSRDESPCQGASCARQRGRTINGALLSRNAAVLQQAVRPVYSATRSVHRCNCCLATGHASVL